MRVSVVVLAWPIPAGPMNHGSTSASVLLSPHFQFSALLFLLLSSTASLLYSPKLSLPSKLQHLCKRHPGSGMKHGMHALVPVLLASINYIPVSSRPVLYPWLGCQLQLCDGWGVSRKVFSRSCDWDEGKTPISSSPWLAIPTCSCYHGQQLHQDTPAGLIQYLIICQASATQKRIWSSAGTLRCQDGESNCFSWAW